MRKKKQNHATATTTTVHVVADIDYDKLAEAIVKAQNNPRQEKPEIKISNKDLFKKLWAILRGKKDSDGRFSVGLFSLLVTWFLRVITFVGILFFLTTIAFLGFAISNMCWETQYLFSNISFIVILIIFSVLILLITAIIHIAADEIEKTEDRNLVFSVFSNLTSLVALIIALIALKG